MNKAEVALTAFILGAPPSLAQETALGLYGSNLQQKFRKLRNAIPNQYIVVLQ